MAANPSGQHNGEVLARITDSVVARFASGVMLPLVTLILIPLAIAQWRGMVNSIEAVDAKVETVATRQATQERDLTTISTKLDAGLIWRLTELERRFEALQERVDRREGATAPPGR